MQRFCCVAPSNGSFCSPSHMSPVACTICCNIQYSSMFLLAGEQHVIIRLCMTLSSGPCAVLVHFACAISKPHPWRFVCIVSTNWLLYMLMPTELADLQTMTTYWPPCENWQPARVQNRRPVSPAQTAWKKYFASTSPSSMHLKKTSWWKLSQNILEWYLQQPQSQAKAGGYKVQDRWNVSPCFIAHIYSIYSSSSLFQKLFGVLLIQNEKKQTSDKSCSASGAHGDETSRRMIYDSHFHLSTTFTTCEDTIRDCRSNNITKCQPV